MKNTPAVTAVHTQQCVRFTFDPLLGESTHCGAIVKSNTLSDDAKEQAETAHTLRKHAEAVLHFFPRHFMENNNEAENEKLTCSTLKDFLY